MLASLLACLSGSEVVSVIEYLPEIASFFFGFIKDYWIAASASSVLAGFLALAVIRKILRIFDIIKR